MAKQPIEEFRVGRPPGNPEARANALAIKLNALRSLAMGNRPPVLPGDDQIASSQYVANASPRRTRIKFMRLDEVSGLPMFDSESSGDVYEQATVQAFSALQDEFIDTTEQWKIHNPWGAPIDVDELVACVFSDVTNRYVPLEIVTVRTAHTVPEVDAGSESSSAGYPTRLEEPNTYPIKFVRVSYTETAGQQTATVVELQPTLATPDAYVHNLFAPRLSDPQQSDSTGTEESGYIPEGTLIQVYLLNGQWFTFHHEEIVWFRRGTLVGALSAGGSASMSPYEGGTITIHDEMMLAGQSLSTGAVVYAQWDNASNRYWLIASNPCPS